MSEERGKNCYVKLDQFHVRFEVNTLLTWCPPPHLTLRANRSAHMAHTAASHTGSRWEDRHASQGGIM